MKPRDRLRTLWFVFRNLKSNLGYAVIYDAEDLRTGELQENYYGWFSTPEEAVRVFNEAYPSTNPTSLTERIVPGSVNVVLVLDQVNNYKRTSA